MVFAILILLSGSFIHHRITYAPFYNFKREVCEAHPEIEKVELSLVNRGQRCWIEVYLQANEDDLTVERLFIDLLKRVNEEPLSSFLKGTAESDWLHVHILFMEGSNYSFSSEQYSRAEWFTEENQKVQKWKNDDTKKVYYYRDYVE